MPSEIQASAEIALGIAISIAAIALAEKYHDIADEALDNQKEIADRIFEIQKWITDHWMANQYPQQQYAISTLYSLSAPSPNASAILGTIRNAGARTANAARRGLNNIYSRYRVQYCRRSCVTDIDVAEAIAITNSSHHLLRSAERWRYEIDNVNRKFAADAYYGSREPPDDMFALLAHAQHTYGNIANSAIQSTDGVIGLIGTGMGVFLDGGL